MKKKILIDPRWINTGGIGTFYRCINKINKYTHMQINGSQVSPIDTIRSAVALLKVRNAVAFFPGYIPPLFSLIPYVITLHDLNHIDRKENSSFIKRIYYNLIIKRGCKKACYIFTVSEFSRRRIIEWSGVNESKVINVGNAVSADFSQIGDKIKYDFDYLLCVSNRKKHKNEIRTLEAFQQANIDQNIRLVFTGNPDEAILKAIETLRIEDRVIFTGYIENNELPKLYRSAKALIFMSLYEGFGLPIIEAQASGTPVITSYTTSLKEVAGHGALLADPYDVISIAEKITEVFNNITTSNDLILKGFENVKRFDWKKTAGIVDEYLNRCT